MKHFRLQRSLASGRVAFFALARRHLWQISSGPEMVPFSDHHPTPRQRQNVSAHRAALAGVPHDPAHPVLVLLERIAKGPDAARLQTNPGAT